MADDMHPQSGSFRDRRSAGSSDGPEYSMSTAAAEDSVSATSSPTPEEISGEVLERISRYALQRQLGKGGFGTVYLAWDELLQRQVAIKVPRSRYASSPKRRAEFLREARMAARLRTPGIVTIHDFGVDEQDRCYLVYEFVAGPSLRSRMASGPPLSVRQVVELVIALAEALNAAHKAGLVHRDLKPTNIMLDDAGRPRITDFGLAVDEELQHLLHGEISGTLPYMSPEQLRGETSQLDGRVDIWALGVIFYELLTGRRPFHGAEAADLVDDILNREPKPPRQFIDTLPREIEQVCLRCLAKRATDRYSAAIDLAQELREYLPVESASGPPPTRFVAANADQVTGAMVVDTPACASAATRARWFVIAAILLVSTGIAVWAQWFRGTAEPPRPSDNGARSGESSPVVPHSAPLPHYAKPMLQRVRIVTEPSNARIVLYGFDPKYGLVDPSQAVRPEERTPLELELWSGQYFVVAVLDDGRFQEVYRHVPPDPLAMPVFPYSHTSWRIRDEGIVELYEIEIPDRSVCEEMAHFLGSEDFEVGQQDDFTVPVHRRRVPPFYLDCREVTLGEYKIVSEQSPPWFLDQWQGVPLPDDHAAVMVFVDHAIAHAEKVGKRLPWEVEYEFAATMGGTRAFPWGDDAGRIEKWQFGPAGEPAFDRVDADHPVYGLFSNVAEWTVSWASPYPPRLDYQPKFPPRRPGEFAVRGGPTSVIRRESDGHDWSLGPRTRILLGDRDYYPGLGFRCARSAKPHLNPEDFEKILLP